VGAKYSRKELFEQLVNSYSEHPHMSPQQAKTILEDNDVIKHSTMHCQKYILKVLYNENRGGSKLVSIDPFLINCLVGRRNIPAPNGHHHERSINVFSVRSSF
jgi:hypothetical protein